MTNAEWLAVERTDELARIIHDSDECCGYCAYSGRCEDAVDCEAGILEWLKGERVGGGDGK